MVIDSRKLQMEIALSLMLPVLVKILLIIECKENRMIINFRPDGNVIAAVMQQSTDKINKFEMNSEILNMDKGKYHC